MTAFYNEIDSFPAQWLENLIDAGRLPFGSVSTLPIQRIHPDVPYATSHFFAGIGGWPLALRMAGFPDDFPVWTGSCPCQPFSQSGAKRGFSDDRHLWPDWFKLIAKRKPPVIFGEQVASPDGLRWFDLVSDDLEDAGYTVGAADLSAAGAGAPHIRQRLYFVAYTRGEGRGLLRGLRISRDEHASRGDDAHGRGESLLDDPEGGRLDQGRLPQSGTGERPREDRRRPGSPDAGGMCLGDSDVPGRQEREGPAGDTPAGERPPLAAGSLRMGDARQSRSGRNAGAVSPAQGGSGAERHDAGNLADEPFAPSARGGAPSGFWGDCDWIPCRDPKRGIVYRPVEPQHVEVVDGVSDSLGPSGSAIITSGPLMVGAFSRVGRLRGYGNSIVPHLAAQFALAALEAVD